MERTDNLNITGVAPLISPRELKAEFPLDDELSMRVSKARQDIQNILTRRDRRILVILGPCSMHDKEADLEYARRLKALQDEIGPGILLVMRAYFEKPRTSLGWKGMLYDPRMDESDDIQQGLRLSRDCLREILRIGLPAATEILDPITPQFLADMVSWASIGARTAASQIHRQMASGLSMPIGFKNGLDGDLHVVMEAIISGSAPHAFIGIDGEGKTSLFTTRGNAFGHPVLRGGANRPNYQSEYVALTENLLVKNRIPAGLIIDCSHANSGKDHRRQRVAFHDAIDQIRAGTGIIRGLMLESFLREGNQPLPPPSGGPESLEYGISVTDKCIGWDETEELIRYLAGALA